MTQAINQGGAQIKPIDASFSKAVKNGQKQAEEWLSLLRRPISSMVGLSIVIVISVIIGAAMIFLAAVPRPSFIPLPPSISSQTLTYESKTYGYHLRYSNSWTYNVSEASASGEIEEVIFKGNGDKIVVATTKKTSEDTLIPASPTIMVLNGVNAIRYHDYDPATGLPLDRVVIERDDGLYHELRGFGSMFERLVRSFTLVLK